MPKSAQEHLFGAHHFGVVSLRGAFYLLIVPLPHRGICKGAATPEVAPFWAFFVPCATQGPERHPFLLPAQRRARKRPPFCFLRCAGPEKDPLFASCVTQGPKKTPFLLPAQRRARKRPPFCFLRNAGPEKDPLFASCATQGSERPPFLLPALCRKQKRSHFPRREGVSRNRRLAL